MMKAVIFIIILHFSCLIFAQNDFTLKGKVTNSNEESIYGEVALFVKDNEVPYKFTLIEEGGFALNEVRTGNYTLVVYSLGYVDYELEVSVNKDVELMIKLEDAEENLSEVVIIAEHKIIENNNGNIKLNVEQTTLSSLGTPADILSRLPGAIVNPNQTGVSIIGKGNPLIYLDNQRITFEQFNTMPVESIRSIEIINNPSAKYESDGRAVLLVTRTESYVDGYNVSIRNVTAKRRRWNNWASTNANLKKGKMEAKLNFGYNKLNPFEGGFTETNILLQGINSNVDTESFTDRNQFTYGGGIYYKINDGDYISANANYRDHSDVGLITSLTSLREINFVDTLLTKIPEMGERGRLTSNINYNKSLKAIKANLFVGGQFSRYFRNNDSTIRSSSEISGFFYEEARDQDFSVDATAVRVDFEKEFENESRWEVGINISNTTADAFSDFDFLGQRDEVIRSYDYNENNYAAYMQYSSKIDKTNYSFGLRAEKNKVEGKFADMDDLLIERNQLTLFPVARISHPVGEKGNLALDYRRTITRPHFLNATTISTFIGPLNEYTRNVNLRPAIQDEISFTYQLGVQSIALRYSFQQFPTFTLPVYDEQSERIITSPENWDSWKTFRLVYVYPFHKNKWRSTIYFMPTLSIVKESRAEPTKSRPFFYIYNNTSFQINDKSTIGITIWGLPDRRNGVFEMKSYYVLGASFQQKLNEHFTITLNANDILNQWRIISSATINDILVASNRLTDGNEYSITLSYSFGKVFKSTYKNEDVDDNLSRF